MGERRGECRVMVGKLGEERELGRPRCRWKIILRWIYRKSNAEALDWIDLVRDRERWRALVNVVMNLRVP